MQDPKVRLIKGEFGAKGIVILVALLCDIYHSNGYFQVWDNDSCFLMADAVGCGIVPENITQVVQGCLRRSFFDEGVFQMFGILTSRGIQRRYIRAVSNRDEINFIKEYWLLDMNVRKDVPARVFKKVTFKSINLQNNPVKSEINPVKSENNPQSKKKVKEKEKESKGKDILPGAETAPARSSSESPPVITLTLNDKSEYPIFPAQVEEWGSLFQAVDIMQELRKMKAWLNANPTKRKTIKGIQRFINSWLSREQDNGGKFRASNPVKNNGSSFASLLKEELDG